MQILGKSWVLAPNQCFEYERLPFQYLKQEAESNKQVQDFVNNAKFSPIL